MRCSDGEQKEGVGTRIPESKRGRTSYLYFGNVWERAPPLPRFWERAALRFGNFGTTQSLLGTCGTFGNVCAAPLLGERAERFWERAPPHFWERAERLGT